MKSFIFPVLLIFASLAISCGGSQSDEGSADNQPNIILLMIDDCSAVEYSCYATDNHPSGNQTPVLDKLAAEGLRFTTCWATPLCAPTRAMLMTGKYGSQTGMYGNALRRRDPDFASNHVPISKVLKDNGYETAVSGKWHLPGSPRQEEYGMDEYSLLGGYFGGGGLEHTHEGYWFSWSDAGKNIYDSAVIGQNRGLSAALYWWGPVIENDELLPSDSNTYAPDLCQDFAIDFIARERDKPFFLYYPVVLPHDPWFQTPDPENPGQRTEQGFDSQLRYVEYYLDELVNTLKENDLYENTVILFTADNATLQNGKGSCSEFGVRVPLVVFGGPVKARGVSDVLVDLTDMYPTISELAGVDVDSMENLDGKSLKPLLDGEQFTGKEYIFSYVDLEQTVRTKEYMMDGSGGIWKCAESGNLLDYTPMEENAKTEQIRSELMAIISQYPPPTVEEFGERRFERVKPDYPWKEHHPTTLDAYLAGDTWMFHPRRKTPGGLKWDKKD
ncbi:sulfatase-like hydrolase/transferase [Bacteroidota bacterium]